MFTLPQIKAAFDPGKHPRGNPKNRGEFASHGGAHRSGFGLPRTSAKPAAMPARHNPLLESLFAEPTQATKPAASTAAIRSNPLLESIFGESTPKKPLEHDPAYKPDNPLRAPGTGKPPANLGSPKSVDEARDQLIWLLGRSTILRQRGREMGRATPKMTRELTRNINLAQRLRHQFFRGQEAGQAQKEAAEKKQAAKSFHLPPL